jgi:nitrogen regulatory protein PII 2
MKEILAFIRKNMTEPTKRALADAGFPAYTGRNVTGRGKLPADVVTPNAVYKSGFMAKRAMLIVTEDQDTDRVVDVILSVNSSGNMGDGKIFVTPVLRGYTVSDGVISQ